MQIKRQTNFKKENPIQGLQFAIKTEQFTTTTEATTTTTAAATTATATTTTERNKKHQFCFFTIRILFPGAAIAPGLPDGSF
jgi:hypothetical protein